MDNSKDVELRIRARDFSQKTLDQVVQSLKELKDAQEAQLQSAKKGDVSARELEASYKRMEAAAAALVKQGALAKVYEDQAKALSEVEQRVESARQKQSEYAKSIAAVTEPTKAQVKATKDFANEVTRAETAQRRAADRLEKTAEALRAYGISTTGIADVQRKIAVEVAGANAALERQDAAVNNLAGDLRKLAVAEKESAAAAQAGAQLEAAQAAEAAAAARFEADRKSNTEAIRRAEYERTWIGLLEQREQQEKAVAAEIERRRVATVAAMASDLKALEAKQKEVAAAREQADALKLLGQQLQANAKGYATLASAQRTQTPQFNLAGNLRDIADPASAAVRSVGGVETALANLERRVSAINGPVRQAAESMRQLEQAQRSAVNIAQSVDAYQRQIAVLREARTEYVNARSAVRDLAAQLQAGTGGNDITQRMAAAEGNLRRAAQAMAAQRDTTRSLREELSKAGVDTAKLGAEKERLVAASNRAATAVSNLKKGVQQYGTAAKDADAKSEGFMTRLLGLGTGGRTTLSFLQRLKGEFLAIAAASVGVYGALNLISGSLDQVRTKAKVEIGLTQLFDGDRAKAQAEMDYLRRTADQIGFVYNTGASIYTRFATAAKASGTSLQEIRYIFEQVSSAAVKAGMSNEDYEGTLKAVEQMMSKGQVQAEELKGQLGDRLPGAVAKFASGLGMTVAELGKAMEAGEVSSQAVVNFARQLEKDGAVVIDTAAVALQKSEAAFTNAKNDFQLAIAESGFAQEYAQFLTDLATLLRSPEGQAFAAELGDLLQGVVIVLRTVVNNLDLVKDTLTTIGTVIGIAAFAKFLAWVGSLGTLIAGIPAALTAMSTAVTGVGTAVGIAGGGVALFTRGLGILLRGVFPVVGVLYTLWEAFNIGSEALARYNKAKSLAEGGNFNLPDTGNGGGRGNNTPVAAYFRPTQDPGTGVTNDDRLLSGEKKAAEKADKDLTEQRRAQLLRQNKDNLAARQKLATEELSARRARLASEITDEGKRAEALKAIDKQIATARETERIKYDNDHAASTKATGKREESLAEKRKLLVQDVLREIKKAEDEVAANEAKLDPTASFEKRLSLRLATIDNAYNELLKKIDKIAAFDPGKGALLRAQTQELIKQRKAVEETKLRTEELQRLEKVLSDTQALRSQKLEEIRAKFAAGVIGYDEMRQAVADTNDVFGIGIGKALDDVQAFAETMKATLDPTAYETLMSRLATLRAQNNPAKTNADTAVTEQEALVNRLLDERKRKLDEIDQQQKLGLITQDEAIAKTNAVNAAYKQQILDATSVLLSYITTAQSLTTDPATLAALDALAAKIRATRQETEATTTAFTGFEQAMIASAAVKLNTALGDVVNTLGEIVTGQQTVGGGFRSLAMIGLQMFRSLIQEALLYIIKLQIINALKGSGNPYLAGIGTAMSAGTKHTGGTAGSPSGSTRSFHPAMLGTAMQLHTGGMAAGGSPSGLSNNEVLRVLEKNEYVATVNDPLHPRNAGKSASGSRFVLVDDRSKVPEAMASAQGDDVIIQSLTRNVATLKSLVNS